MRKILLIALLGVIAIFSTELAEARRNKNCCYNYNYQYTIDTSRMPVPLTDASVVKYLESSVRILSKGTKPCSWFGSGTVIGEYDGWTYVQSCAHIFTNVNAAPQYCGIEIFYKDGKKLDRTLTYEAEVLGVNHAIDVSFIRFKADYKVPCFRIAPVDYKFVKDTWFISSGYDQSADFMAAYKTQFCGFYDVDLGIYLCPKCGKFHDGYNAKSMTTTFHGSARHGRSGGGLLSSDGFLVGICSRGSEIDYGTGWTYFVKLSDIHDFAKQLKLDFLLNDVWKNVEVHTENGVVSSDVVPKP